MLIARVSLASFVAFVSDLTETSLTNNAGDKDNFSDKTTSLVNEDKTEEAIKLVNSRVKTHPNDEGAYWYRRLAIADFNTVEKQVPSWKQRFIPRLTGQRRSSPC